MDEVGVGNRGGRKRGEVVVGVARDVAGLVVSLKVVETARDVEGDVTLDLFISLGQSSLSFPLILQPSPFLSFLRFLFLSSHYTSPPPHTLLRFSLSSFLLFIFPHIFPSHFYICLFFFFFHISTHFPYFLLSSYLCNIFIFLYFFTAFFSPLPFPNRLSRI